MNTQRLGWFPVWVRAGTSAFLTKHTALGPGGLKPSSHELPLACPRPGDRTSISINDHDHDKELVQPQQEIQKVGTSLTGNSVASR